MSRARAVGRGGGALLALVLAAADPAQAQVRPRQDTIRTDAQGRRVDAQGRPVLADTSRQGPAQDTSRGRRTLPTAPSRSFQNPDSVV